MDEGTREEKEASDQSDQGKASDQSRRWGTHVDIDITDYSVNGFDYGIEEPREAFREAFVQGLRNLADKIKVKDEKGQYLYFLPAKISIAVDTSQKFFIRFIFSCSTGEEGAGEIRDDREN